MGMSLPFRLGRLALAVTFRLEADRLLQFTDMSEQIDALLLGPGQAAAVEMLRQD